uniref:Uncharacterized protein n=1 Tax=Magallana gigas TaxID=29159 RepID=K1QAC5_MAGGI
MNGGSVRLESLTAWRCEVFVRHSDISHGEFHNFTKEEGTNRMGLGRGFIS